LLKSFYEETAANIQIRAVIEPLNFLSCSTLMKWYTYIFALLSTNPT